MTHKQHGIDVEELKRSGLVKLREKDMFSVWVKTSCCNLNAAQLRKLAEITEKYARGFLLFTTRQIPIIPFVNIKDVEELKRELSEVYLELDRCGPRVRNINVCYSDKICSEAVTECLSLGEKLESFFRDPILHKIKIGVSGCKKDCIISRVLNDISFVGVEKDGFDSYDAYVGGRLGLNPFVGVKLAERLSEEECVRFVRNYFDLLRREGKSGERSADLVSRLGAPMMRQELNRDLKQGTPIKPVACQTRLQQKETDKDIVRIRATCGEVTSKQLRRIADIAEKYGEGFVHFAVRGSPEIPCVNKRDLESIRRELQEVSLRILDTGVDNLQACFGNYCTESIVDPQFLLRRIEEKVEELGLNNTDIKISASGCPNSCGIAHLSDLGFHGVLEPEVDINNCTGCGLCVPVCKRKAIEMKNDVAVIDKDRCRYCGSCVAVCPVGGINEKRRGFAVLAGGRGGEDTRLGQTVTEFLSENEALQVAEMYLNMVKQSNLNAAALIDRVGLAKFKEMLVSVVR